MATSSRLQKLIAPIILKLVDYNNNYDTSSSSRPPLEKADIITPPPPPPPPPPSPPSQSHALHPSLSYIDDDFHIRHPFLSSILYPSPQTHQKAQTSSSSSFPPLFPSISNPLNLKPPIRKPPSSSRPIPKNTKGAALDKKRNKKQDDLSKSNDDHGDGEEVVFYVDRNPTISPEAALLPLHLRFSTFLKELRAILLGLNHDIIFGDLGVLHPYHVRPLFNIVLISEVGIPPREIKLIIKCRKFDAYMIGYKGEEGVWIEVERKSMPWATRNPYFRERYNDKAKIGSYVGLSGISKDVRELYEIGDRGKQKPFLRLVRNIMEPTRFEEFGDFLIEADKEDHQAFVSILPSHVKMIENWGPMSENLVKDWKGVEPFELKDREGNVIFTKEEVIKALALVKFPNPNKEK